MAEEQSAGTGQATGGAIFSFDSPGDAAGNPGKQQPDNGGNSGAFDPSSLAGNPGPGPAPEQPAKRGRGRPKGSGNRSTAGAAATAAPLDLNFIQFTLLGIHGMLASSLHVPELELTDVEAKKLAEAIQNVSKHYPVAIDPKTQAWLSLVMVAGSLYGTRAVAYYTRIQAEKNKPQPVAEGAPFGLRSVGP